MLIALSYQNATFLPIYVGVEKGFFAQEGVDLDYVYVQGGNKSKTARLAMKGDVAFLDGASTSIEAVVRGWGMLKVLCSGVRVPFFLMVRPNIEKVADLKGKRIITGSGGRAFNEVLYISKLNGWEPGKDITIIKGSPTDRIEAFQDPGIDAVATRPQFRHWAEQNGFRSLDYEGGKCWYSGGIAATPQMIEEKPEIVSRVVKVYLKAIDFIKANREESVRIILKEVPYLDYEGASGNYDVLHDLWSPLLERPGVEHMAEVCRAVKGSTLRPSFEDMVDLSFLKEI
jgi:NitT/TauT family transport system substrate-binding protein